MNSAVESVTIPASVREIGKEAFCRCWELQQVEFAEGSSLKTLGTGCFTYCAFEEIALPRSVEAIGDYAFCGCTELKNVVFQPGCRLRRLGECCFRKTDVDESSVLKVLETGKGERC